MPLFTCFAPCPRGLEELLANELATLGLHSPNSVPGGVKFQADWAGIMRANLWSRLATRILLQIKHGSYRNEQDIYDLTQQIDWLHWYDVNSTLRVDVTGIRCPLKSLDFATLRIKDAICDHYREACGERPTVNTADPDIRVHAFLNEAYCTLYLDTSGEPLFKRGWRQDKGNAPIKENLAAGLLQIAGWTPAQALLDPFCGSGTILVEALLLGLNIAPGLARTFGFQAMLPCPLDVWQQEKQAARAARQLRPLQIHGSDIDADVIYKARRNIQRVGVLYDLPEDFALPAVTVSNATERSPVAASGMIITNPPYGERMVAHNQQQSWEDRQAQRQAQSEDKRRQAPRQQTVSTPDPQQVRDEEAITAVFSDWAHNLKRHYAGWSAYTISGDLQLPRKMRLKESQRTPIFNGALECRFFRFEMVAGSARKPKAAAE